VHRDQAPKWIGWIRHVFPVGFWRQLGGTARSQRSEASLVMRLPCVEGVGVSPEEPEIGRRGLGGVEYLCHIGCVGQVRTCPLLDGLDEVPQLEAPERDRVEQYEFAAVVVVLRPAKQRVISICAATLVSYRVGVTAEEAVMRGEAACIDIIDEFIRLKVCEKRRPRQVETPCSCGGVPGRGECALLSWLD
jgi:hypothetical protein